MTCSALSPGLELSFFSGVYSTCVGNTRKLPSSKALVGMSGMLTGVGEIIGQSRPQEGS